jgi:hypothetical protein
MTAYNAHALSLYCDNTTAASILYPHEAQPGEHHSGEFPAVFYARTRAICRQQAREAGWKLNLTGRTLCPRCVKAGLR